MCIPRLCSLLLDITWPGVSHESEFFRMLLPKGNIGFLKCSTNDHLKVLRSDSFLEYQT